MRTWWRVVVLVSVSAFAGGVVHGVLVAAGLDGTGASILGITAAGAIAFGIGIWLVLAQERAPVRSRQVRTAVPATNVGPRPTVTPREYGEAMRDVKAQLAGHAPTPALDRVRRAVAAKPALDKPPF